MSEGCYLWSGSVSVQGYGVAHVRGRKVPAHRLVYTMVVGEIPDGHELHHRCHTKLCCNVDHLEPITMAEHRRLHGIEKRANPERGMTGAERQRASRARWSPEKLALERAKNAARTLALYYRKKGRDVTAAL